MQKVKTIPPEVTSILARLHLQKLKMEHKVSEKASQKVLRCVLDPKDYSIVAVNGDWIELTGYSQEEVVGDDFLSYFDSEEIPEKSGKHYLKTRRGKILLKWSFDASEITGAFILRGTLT